MRREEDEGDMNGIDDIVGGRFGIMVPPLPLVGVWTSGLTHGGGEYATPRASDADRVDTWLAQINRPASGRYLGISDSWWTKTRE